ncbi:hypothetical protein ACFY20_26250 [Streptomyces sp. NPDC001312]|uniref:hypothetical protein n=1 Tax=Streptomyces sp. NPDC001312 TaxID=3364561 RepID=UPI0036C709AB
MAELFPAPGLLAPSVLRVQAFLELPFVLMAFATVVRWLDVGLYRRLARSALLPLASVSYTTVFCLVEWDLRNPYTIDDVVIRAVSAVVTPLLIARVAARDESTFRVPSSVPGLLVFTGSLGSLGALVLVVYDTALLYNLGRLDDRLPLAQAAGGALLGLRAVASRPAAAGSAPTLSFVVHVLRHWLLLFFVPALAIRYGLLFGTPALALAAGALTAAVACVHAGRTPWPAPNGTPAPPSALRLASAARSWPEPSPPPWPPAHPALVGGDSPAVGHGRLPGDGRRGVRPRRQPRGSFAREVGKVPVIKSLGVDSTPRSKAVRPARHIH